MRKIKVANRSIGSSEPVFIIAEAGVNHNGDLEMAKELVVEAKKSGADCVKFQTFKAERVATANAPKAKYQLNTTDPVESQVDMLKKCELQMDHHIQLMELCEKLDIIFLSTPYNIEDVDFLDSIDVSAYKLASIHIAEPYFIEYVASKNRPIILSTGMATQLEVEDAVNILNSSGNKNFALLQCTTNYPSDLVDANLKAMKSMKDLFETVVGYSDHTIGETACIASVALGAKIIEKHFTLDKSLSGPDHSSSSTPNEFAELVNKIRKTELALGSKQKAPSEIEQKNSIGMRRSIVSKIKIDKGLKIKDEMISFKRPATGISPKYINKVLGKTAVEAINPDTILEWDMLK